MRRVGHFVEAIIFNSRWLIAPFLLIGIVLVAADRNVMAGQPSSRVSLLVILATALLMFAAALGLFGLVALNLRDALSAAEERVEVRAFLADSTPGALASATLPA